MHSTTEKLSVLEKVGYSLGDLAANLIFQTLMTFLAFYYTDIYGIQANTAAAIMFFGGMFGAFFNPVMGIIADRTQTRWGKFRPWLLWTAIPFGVISVLMFTTPDFNQTGKIVYAITTYTLLVAIYSANNLPYSALSGVLTGSMKERNSLSSYRFTAVLVAQFLIQVLLLPLVLIMGGGDKAEGFKATMTLFAFVGIACFLIAFITTKERVVPKQEQKSKVREDIHDLLKNQPWLVMLIVTVFVFITLAIKGGSTIYYFENYLSTTHLASFLEDIGFNSFISGLNSFLNSIGLTKFQWPEDAATSAFSLFNAAGIICMMIGLGFSKSLADKFGKRIVYGVSLFVSTIFILAFYLIPAESIGTVFLMQILHGLAYGVTIPVLWAMIADVADYSEWKNHRRATAIIFSAMIFGLKSGLSIGGALVAKILAIYAYDASLLQQSAETIQGIKMLVSVFCSLPFFIAVGCLFFYEIDKQKELQIEKELKERHEAG